MADLGTRWLQAAKRFLKRIALVRWLWQARHEPRARLEALAHLPRNGLLRLQAALRGEPPIPPGRLIVLVAGTPDVAWFLTSGRLAADSIRSALLKSGIEPTGLREVLDFGCGVGRVIRHFRPLATTRLTGYDLNADLIAWCRDHLRFAQFRTNAMAARLAEDDGRFDLVYALSVFTHLTEATQAFWMTELRRVVRPGGLLLLTTHGDFYRDRLPAEEAVRYDRGELVVLGAEREGSNVCAAFHPQAYVSGRLGAGLELLRFEAEGALGNPRQDLWLFRKPAR